MSSNEAYKRRRKWKSGPPMCSFYLRGKCKNTINCKFSHEAVAKDKSNVPVCPYWARRECRYGDACTFKHSTDDVDVLTERYNAQLLAAASMDLHYVYDPTTGTTYPVQASSEYAPAHAQPYYQGSTPGLNPAFPTLPIPTQVSVPAGQQYAPHNSSPTFLAAGQYPKPLVVPQVKGYQPQTASSVPLYALPPPSKAEAFPEQAVSGMYTQALGSNETVKNSSTKKRKREEIDVGRTSGFSPTSQRRRLNETNVGRQ